MKIKIFRPKDELDTEQKRLYQEHGVHPTDKAFKRDFVEISEADIPIQNGDVIDVVGFRYFIAYPTIERLKGDKH